MNKEKTPEKKGKGINPAMVVLLVIVVVLLLIALQGGGGKKSETQRAEDPKKTPAAVTAPVQSSNDALRRLGKTLVIGSALENTVADGTEVVLPKDFDAMNDVLDSKDVDAFVRLMEKHGIRSVLVSPGIAKRNPIPKNTVRNRLALANPAGRLSATYMTRDFFVYRLTAGPPPLTEKDKSDMMQIIRAQVGIPGVQRPDEMSPLLKQGGEWHVMLTVRPLHNKHLSFHSVRADTLEKAANELAGRLSRYYEKQNFARHFGPLRTALEDKLGLELEVIFDKGVFTGPRDRIFMWRILEPGIFGVEMEIGGKTFELPVWYPVANNYRTVASFMERIVHEKAGLPKDYWLRADVPIWRFRSVHWREMSPGGEVQDMYRGNQNVYPPRDVTKQALVSSLEGFGNWFYNNTRHYTDDRMIYRYYPTTNTENREYNQVRHALGAFSMAMVNEFVQKPEHKEVADSCLRWMEKRIRWGGAPRKQDGTIDTGSDTWQGKPLPGADIAILEADENMYDPKKGPAWSNKMGAVAVAILGYTQYKRAGWTLTAEQEKYLQGLANFILYMQKEDGSFHHYYVAQNNSYYGQRNSIYPGEILYAVARLYGETGDERYKAAFNASMKTNLDWFKREMSQREPDGTYAEERRKELVQFQPWIAMSMEEMYRYDKNPDYLDASNLVSQWIIDSYEFDDTRAFYPDYLGGYLKVLDELPAMHTFVYTEGTAASYVLAREAGASTEVVEKLRRGALLSARFILQQQIRENDNDFLYPVPKRAAGGVKYCLNHNKQRIDYTYHALSSIYRILHAATAEDYAYIQSVELPPAY
ncbi:MAG: hypothetical protein JXX14_00995 [Deltaproteobacteria bacterium]|nr:hypothetical protein [Deltaproteobacteria bacterium]